MSDAAQSQESPRPPAYAVVIPSSGIAMLVLLAAGSFAGLVMIDRGRSAIALIAGAATAAILLQPTLEAISRHIPRAVAFVVITLGLVVGLTALVGVVTWDLDRQAAAFSDALTDAIGRLRAGSAAARVAERLDLADRVRAAFDGAAARWVIGTDDPIAIAGLVARVIVVAVLAAFMLAGGKRIVASAIAAVRRTSIRATMHRVAFAAVGRGGGLVRRTLATSLAHGVLAGLVAWAFDLPGPISVGAWVTMTITVPIVGGPLAWLPVVALAWAGEAHPWTVAAIGLVCIVADRVVRRLWVQRHLRLGPLLTLVGVVGGYAVLGLGGAILGLLVVAMVAAAFGEEGDDVAEAVADLVDDRRPATPPGAPPPQLQPVLSIERDPAGHEPARVVRLQLSLRTSLVLLVVIVGAYAVYRGQQELASVGIWLLLGAFIAFGLDRPVSALERRWEAPRAAAIVVVLGAMIGAVTTVIVLSGPSVTDATSSIVEDAPATVQSLESLPLVGPWLREHDASSKVEDGIEQLPENVGDPRLLRRVVSAAGDGIVGAVLLVGMMLATLVDGPRLVRAAQRRLPARRRARADRLGRATYLAISNVAAAAAFVATLNGSVVMLLALALGIPLAPLLGLWAAAWNLIPQVGGFVGALPLVALGLAQSPLTGLIALVVFVTYQTFENHVIQPFVGSRAVHLPPLVMMIGVLVGGSLGGFVGAVLAGPTLGVAKIAIGEWRGDAPRRIEDRPLAERS